jgi:hypothetical protein
MIRVVVCKCKKIDAFTCVEVMPPFTGGTNLFNDLKIFWKLHCSFVRSSMLSTGCRSLRQLSRCSRALASKSSGFSIEKLVTWSMHDQHDGVASLVLNNPGKLNALTVEMGTDFTAAISELASACEKVNIKSIMCTKRC